MREDEQRRAREKLEGLLVEGLREGPARAMTRKDWEEIRSEAVKQFEARRERKAKEWVRSRDGS